MVTAGRRGIHPMGRDIRCRLRLHRYRPKRNADRKVYWECTRCGYVRWKGPDLGAVGPLDGTGDGWS